MGKRIEEGEGIETADASVLEAEKRRRGQIM